MARTLRLPVQLPTLNEIIDASKKHWSGYAAMKDKWDNTIGIYLLAQNFERITEPSYFDFAWHEPRMYRDPDGISVGKKFILDALQKAKLLENDNGTWVLGFQDAFTYGKDVGVVLTVR